MEFLVGIGVGVLGLAVVLVGGAAFIWWKIKKAFKALMSGAAGNPPRITLDPWEGDPTTDLTHAEAFGRLCNEVQEQGFAPAGRYLVPEMAGAVVFCFLDEQGCIAVVYEVMGVDKPWIDFVAVFEGGQKGLTVSTAPMGGELEVKPGQEKIYDAEASTRALFLRFREALGGRTPDRITAESLPGHFTKAYADEQDWRNLKGVTEKEILAVAKRSGQDPSPEVLAQTKIALEEQAAEGLIPLCQELLRAQKGISDKEWVRIENRVVCINAKMQPGAAVRQLMMWLDGEIESEPRAGEDGIALVRRLLAERGKGFEELGTIETPLRAVLWLAPERQGDDDDDDGEGGDGD